MAPSPSDTVNVGHGVTHTDTVGQLKEKLEHQIGPPTYGSVADSTQVVIFIK